MPPRIVQPGLEREILLPQPPKQLRDIFSSTHCPVLLWKQNGGSTGYTLPISVGSCTRSSRMLWVPTHGRTGVPSRASQDSLHLGRWPSWLTCDHKASAGDPGSYTCQSRSYPGRVWLSGTAGMSWGERLSQMAGEGRASMLHLRETPAPSKPLLPIRLPPYSKGPLGLTSCPHNSGPDIVLPKAGSQDGGFFCF